MKTRVPFCYRHVSSGWAPKDILCHHSLLLVVGWINTAHNNPPCTHRYSAATTAARLVLLIIYMDLTCNLSLETLFGLHTPYVYQITTARLHINHTIKTLHFYSVFQCFFLFKKKKGNTLISISTSKKQWILPLNFFSSPLCLDLPPPPEPPPEEIPLEVTHGFTEASIMANGALSSLERSEYSNSHQRKGSGQRHGDSKTRLCTVCVVNKVIAASMFFILPSSLRQTVDDRKTSGSVLLPLHWLNFSLRKPIFCISVVLLQHFEGTSPFVSIFPASADEEMMAYGSKAGYLSRSQMSSNCSTTGSSSSRGSTGSRGLNSARKHSEVGHGG